MAINKVGDINPGDAVALPGVVIEQRPETTVVQLSGGPMAEFPNTVDAVPVQVPPTDEPSAA